MKQILQQINSKYKYQVISALMVVVGLTATQVEAQAIYSTTLTPCESYATKAVSQSQTISLAFNKTGNSQCVVSGPRWTATYAQSKAWCQTNNYASYVRNETRQRGLKILQCLNAIHAPGQPSTNFSNTLLNRSPNWLGQQLTNKAKLNQVARVKKMIAAGAPYQWQGAWGNDGQALKHAIESISLRTTRLLLKIGGYNPNWTSNGGWAPISAVANSNDIKKYPMLRLILNNGASPHSLGQSFDEESRAMHLAIAKNDALAVKILLNKGDNPNLIIGSTLQNVLMRAITQGNPYIVYLLLSNNVNPVDPNINGWGETCGNYQNSNQSPLDLANALGDQFIINHLLFFGALPGSSC